MEMIMILQKYHNHVIAHTLELQTPIHIGSPPPDLVGDPSGYRHLAASLYDFPMNTLSHLLSAIAFSSEVNVQRTNSTST